MQALCAVAFGCGTDTEVAYEPTFDDAPAIAHAGPDYALGVIPLHNALRLHEAYWPLIDALNSGVEGFTVRLEAARDYASYDAKLEAKSLPLALLNPYQAVEAEGLGYRIFAKAKGELRGIIVVRRDGGIRTVDDLRGAAISFPAESALAATMMNRVLLLGLGLDVDRDARPTYVGSQDSSVMNVFLGLTKAGGTWPPTWEAMRQSHPEVTEALEIRWQTPALVSLALAARDDLPEAHVRAILEAVLDLENSDAGRAALRSIQLPGFESANSSDYDAVRTFVADYTRVANHTRPLEPPP